MSSEACGNIDTRLSVALADMRSSDPKWFDERENDDVFLFQKLNETVKRN